MNQILAILKESIWSAAASRLLYLEMIAVVLVLAALAPLGATERVNYRVQRGDIVRPVVLAQQWMRMGTEGDNAQVQLLWNELDSGQQASIKKIAEEKESGGLQETERAIRDAGRGLSRVMNELIEKKSFEDQDVWEGKVDNSQGKQLWERKDSLSDDNRKRLRRLLLQDAFRGQLRQPADSLMTIHYAWYPLSSTRGFSKLNLETQVRSWTPYVLDKIYLTLGVLLAVLVTASLIPQMLEEGSLYLLLSKPITRITLLLTKYVGSGILIFFISAAFLTGVWMILGIRFGIWLPEILWMIPLALVIYLVYFSVTVAAGLLFRNTIIAIVVTMLFAALCYALSLSHWGYSSMLQLYRQSDLQPVDGKVLATDVRGRYHLLDEQGQWQWVYFKLSSEFPREATSEGLGFVEAMAFMPPLARPILQESTGLLIGEVGVAPPENRGNNLLTYFGAARVNDFSELRFPQTLGSVPTGTVGFVFDSSGRLLAISKYGSVFGLDKTGTELLAEVAAGTYEPPVRGEGDDESSEVVPSRQASWELLGAICDSGPSSFERFSYDPATETFWCLGRLGVTRASRNEDGVYQVSHTLQASWEWARTNRTPLVRVADQLLIPQRSGPLVVLSTEDLSVVAEYQLPFQNVPLSAVANDDVAAIAYREDGVWVYRRENQQLEKLSAADGPVTTVAFNSEGKLWMVEDIDRITTVDLTTGNVAESRQPERSQLRLIYDWGVNPLYNILPKPNECYAIVESLATEGFTDVTANDERPEEIQADTDTMEAGGSNPWNPLLSSVAFAVVVMALNCVYFARQQF